MDRHGQRTFSTGQPFLLNFIRPQRIPNLEYHYDDHQRLNVTASEGVPVVATVSGRALLKTKSVVGED